jgi:hypothetical protein
MTTLVCMPLSCHMGFTQTGSGKGPFNPAVGCFGRIAQPQFDFLEMTEGILSLSPVRYFRDYRDVCDHQRCSEARHFPPFFSCHSHTNR